MLSKIDDMVPRVHVRGFVLIVLAFSCCSYGDCIGRSFVFVSPSRGWPAARILYSAFWGLVKDRVLAFEVGECPEESPISLTSIYVTSSIQGCLIRWFKEHTLTRR